MKSLPEHYRTIQLAEAILGQYFGMAADFWMNLQTAYSRTTSEGQR
jgi:plasmid maintenance system antidote protein VapI